MHREIRQGLGAAEGVSEAVVALNLDVRGFTAFAATVDSVDVAIYLRRLYQRLLDDVFPDARFFKLTGDGLLLVFQYRAEDELIELVRSQVERSLSLVERFGSIVDGDRMIYFDVPERVGIGLSRGSACRIVAGEQVLDYTGRPLNQSSRLMHLARPRGVVLDDTIPLDALDAGVRGMFSEDKVYVPGVAEDTPIAVHFTREWTSISPASRLPIAEAHWDEAIDVRELADWKRMIKANFGLGLHVVLPSRPITAQAVSITLTYPEKVGKRQVEASRPLTAEQWEYLDRPEGPTVRVLAQEVVRLVSYDKVPARTQVTTRIHYRTS